MPPGADGKTETLDKAVNATASSCNCDPTCACNSSLLSQEDFANLLVNSDSLSACLLTTLLETAPFPVVFPATSSVVDSSQSLEPFLSLASTAIQNFKPAADQVKKQSTLSVTPVGSAPHALAGIVETGNSSPGLQVDTSTPRLPLDLAETKNAYFLRFDCAGVPRDQVKVDIGSQSRDLRVSVHRLRGKDMMAEYVARGSSIVRWERISGSSTRRIAFPTIADLEKIETTYVDGMLTIKVPKKTGAEFDKAGRNHISVKVEACTL